ncbi:MAG: hypothetical protein ABI837_11600 [Acidobacteriota bacterium]
MVDNTNPTNQFHPYQPTDFVPVKDLPERGLRGMLGRLGIDGGKLGDTLKNVSTNDLIAKARGYAGGNGAKVLGGLAVAAIGLGLLSKRSR